MNSGDTSNRPDSERRQRIFDDLPPSLLHIAFSFAIDGSPRRSTESSKHENTGSEHTGVLYSSRNNQERIILNDTEVIQILPEPTNAIYEPFSSILEDVVIDDSLSQGNSGSDSMNVHYSADKNGTVGVAPPDRLGNQRECSPLNFLVYFSKKGAVSPPHAWIKKFEPIVIQDPMTIRKYLGPGAAMRFKGDRKDKTALTRLSAGHLKTLRFCRGDKKFNMCTKCNMVEVTQQHLLDCVTLVCDDLLKRPDFVLEVMKANDLMDLI
ncbi:hypothetical protein AVEN_131714-1 [Araneus ventricosus]|uniref:Uncharacterized protein n=1 Tax=Araneus ventricosus TaxID=182803 RepID=A0A4Y2N872_ARAVE|nr:hypothetical protein AVEN_131714-1 [Araneus ventricosus]